MPSIDLPSLFLNSVQKGKDIRTIEINLERALFFPTAERIYCTLTQATIPYSFVNISQSVYKNACFNVNIVGPPSFSGELIIPDGIYPSLTELNEAVNSLITEALGLPLPGVDLVDITANTSTNQVIIDTNDGGGAYTTVDIDFECGGKSSLYKELGLPAGTTVSLGAPVVSSQPVLFNDLFASGIMVLCEGDLNVLTYLQNIPNSNVLALCPIANEDSVGSIISYPRDYTIIATPVIQGKTIRKFRIRFVSPLDPTRDLVFLQGDASVVLIFKAVY